MPQKKKFSQKPCTQMNSSELAKATAEFDKEFVADSFSAPTGKALAQLRRAKKRGRGRPKLGSGAERVLITVEPKLLKRADAFAKQSGQSRSELVSRGLRLAIGESVS